MTDFEKFNQKLMGMPDRKGSVADYWYSLDKKELVNFLAQQCYYIDHFMERGDKLEKKVNDLAREKRALSNSLRELGEKVEDIAKEKKSLHSALRKLMQSKD